MSRQCKKTLTPAEFQRLKESFQERLVQDPKMPPACLRVGLAISWHMNHETGEAWPGANAIIKRARVSRATVRRSVEYLVRNNHVLAEKRPGRVTHYTPQPLADQAHSPETGIEATRPVSKLRDHTGIKAMAPH